MASAPLSQPADTGATISRDDLAEHLHGDAAALGSRDDFAQVSARDDFAEVSALEDELVSARAAEQAAELRRQEAAAGLRESFALASEEACLARSRRETRAELQESQACLERASDTNMVMQRRAMAELRTLQSDVRAKQMEQHRRDEEEAALRKQIAQLTKKVSNLTSEVADERLVSEKRLAAEPLHGPQHEVSAVASTLRRRATDLRAKAAAAASEREAHGAALKKRMETNRRRVEEEEAEMAARSHDEARDHERNVAAEAADLDDIRACEDIAKAADARAVAADRRSALLRHEEKEALRRSEGLRGQLELENTRVRERQEDLRALNAELAENKRLVKRLFVWAFIALAVVEVGFRLTETW